MDGSLYINIHEQQLYSIKSMWFSFINLQVWGLSIWIENLRVIPFNSNSWTLRRISRELYQPSLKYSFMRKNILVLVLCTRCHFCTAPNTKNIMVKHTLSSSQKVDKTNSMNLYPPTKGYFRETCKSQNINPCGSVVECLARGRGAAGSSPTGVTALCPWARTLILA